MERPEFESLPPDFFERREARAEPRWLLAAGVVCVVASLAVAAWLLFGA